MAYVPGILCIAVPINTCVLLIVRCAFLFSVCQELMGELCPAISSAFKIRVVQYVYIEII